MRQNLDSSILHVSHRDPLVVTLLLSLARLARGRVLEAVARGDAHKAAVDVLHMVAGNVVAEAEERFLG